MMPRPPGSYEERFGPTALLLAAGNLVLGGGTGWAAVHTDALFLQSGPYRWMLWLPAVSAVISVWSLTSAVRWLVAAVTHRIALRADQHGLTLGAAPFPGRRRVTVPWHDIDGIEIYRAGWRARLTFVGVRLRPDAPSPRGVPEPGTVRARLHRWVTLLDDVPEITRAVHGWRLDEAQLVDAARRYDGRIPVTDGRYYDRPVP